MIEGAWYPSHISELISELKTCQDAGSILLRHVSLIRHDANLARVYSDLGYNSVLKKFPNNIPPDQVISLLLHEYSSHLLSLEPDWDVHRNLKTEFMKAYYDMNMHSLASPRDLGFDWTPSSAEDDYDISLSNMWPEDSSTNKSNQTASDTPPQLKARSNKGLKALSWRVKEVVCSKQHTSYQEVAEELMEQIVDSYSADKEKDERNIRRRVYDALNVLIAAQVITKIGRKVTWRGIPEPSHKLNSALDCKREMLRELAFKKLALEGLVNRNRRGVNTSKCISFPFLVVGVPHKPAYKVFPI